MIRERASQRADVLSGVINSTRIDIRYVLRAKGCPLWFEGLSNKDVSLDAALQGVSSDFGALRCLEARPG